MQGVEPNYFGSAQWDALAFKYKVENRGSGSNDINFTAFPYSSTSTAYPDFGTANFAAFLKERRECHMDTAQKSKMVVQKIKDKKEKEWAQRKPVMMNRDIGMHKATGASKSKHSISR